MWVIVFLIKGILVEFSLGYTYIQFLSNSPSEVKVETKRSVIQNPILNA